MKRDSTFDILKGLAIIFVVIGHSRFPFVVEHFIVSFHMPVFFFVSGYFFKIRDMRTELGNNWNRIMVPYLFTSATMIAVAFIIGLFSGPAWGGVLDQFVTCLVGGQPLIAIPLYGKILNLGPLWFLLALVFIRIMAKFLFALKIHDIAKAFIVIVLAFVGIKTSARGIFMPWFIPSALCGLGFFFVGYQLKARDFANARPAAKWALLITSVACWIYCVLYSGMSINAAAFGAHYVFDVYGALGATLLCYLLSKKMAQGSNAVQRYFNFMGKYSLLVLCIHTVELQFVPWESIIASLPMHRVMATTILCLCRIAAISTLTWMALKNSFIKDKVFKYKI